MRVAYVGPHNQHSFNAVFGLLGVEDSRAHRYESFEACYAADRVRPDFDLVVVNLKFIQSPVESFQKIVLPKAILALYLGAPKTKITFGKKIAYAHLQKQEKVRRLAPLFSQQALRNPKDWPAMLTTEAEQILAERRRQKEQRRRYSWH